MNIYTKQGKLKNMNLMQRAYKEQIGSTKPSNGFKHLVDSELAGVEEYVARVFKSIFPGGGEGSNLTFLRLERLTPQEVLDYSRNSSRDKEYNISRNSFYWVRVVFKYADYTEELTHHILLPYVREYGLLEIGGNDRWIIKPVSSDKALSPSNNSVFLRLLRIKAEFRKYEYMVSMTKPHKDPHMVKPQRVLGDIQYHDLYKAKEKDSIPLNAKPTTILYLLVEYGFRRTMKELLGYPVVVGTIDDLHKKYSGKRYIFQPTTLKPTNRKHNESNFTKPVPKYADYTPADIAIAVDPKYIKTQADERMLINMMAAGMYVVDNNPDLTVDDLENKDIWLGILGVTSMGNKQNSIVTKNINAHLSNKILDVDSFMKAILKSEFGDTLGVDIQKLGFNGILIAMMRNFYEWTKASTEIIGTGYDKRFTVLYYLLFELTSNINLIQKDLSTTERKKNKDSMEVLPSNRNKDRPAGNVLIKEVKTAISKNLYSKLIFKIKKATHQCTEAIEFAGDNASLKLLSTVEIQSNISASGPTGPSSTRSVIDPTTKLDASHLVCGTVGAVSKSKLSPLNHPNYYMNLNPETQTVQRTKEDERELKKLYDILSTTDGRGKASGVPAAFRYR